MKPSKPNSRTSLRGFIRFFEKIPSDGWCAFSYAKGKKHCAAGHLGMTNRTPILVAASRLFELAPVVMLVNDGKDTRFQQPDPKSRVLAYLRSLLRAK